jgi:hypothetical protein
LPFTPQPQADAELRRQLLDFYVENQSSVELANWLREIGQDPRGTIEERKAKVRAHTKYLQMPAEGFPRQTRYYLDALRVEDLAALCETLGLRDDGTRECLYRRLLREVGQREQWLPKLPTETMLVPEDLALFVDWYPIVQRGKYEKDFYRALDEELREVCGHAEVHEQLPIAHGTTLKVDYHVGHPQGRGIGIEVKMPTNNGDVQRCLGQIDQYLHRYGSDFILLLLPDFMNAASLTFMIDQLRLKDVRCVIKNDH